MCLWQSLRYLFMLPAFLRLRPWSDGHDVRVQCSSLAVQAAREELREREASHDAAMSAVRQESDDLRHELAQQRQQARLPDNDLAPHISARWRTTDRSPDGVMLSCCGICSDNSVR